MAHNRGPWWIPALAATFIVVVLLLFLGEKGAEISQVFGLGAAVLACLVALIPERQNLRAPRNVPATRGRPPWPVVVAVVTALLVAVWYFLLQKPDRNITDLVRLAGWERLQDGAAATLLLPQGGPWREHLAVTLVLSNRNEAGNCVGPARLRLTPTVDGRQGAPVVTESGREARVSLGDVERVAVVSAKLEIGDPACELDLRLSQAVLFN